jgi:hypothetical protein
MRLEARLGNAAEARARHVSSLSARAGARVARARSLGAASRARLESEAQAKKLKLEERMRLAEERRQAALRSPRSPGRDSPRDDRQPPLQSPSSANAAGGGGGFRDGDCASHKPLIPKETETAAEEEGRQQLLLRVDQFRRQVSCRKLQQVQGAAPLNRVTLYS